MDYGPEGSKTKSWETSEAIIAIGVMRYRISDLKAFLVSVRLEKTEWLLRHFWQRVNRN